MTKPMTDSEIFSFDEGPTMPTKTWQQVLQENPQHAGGLAQLASAEQGAQSRSTAVQQPRSKSAP